MNTVTDCVSSVETKQRGTSVELTIEKRNPQNGRENQKSNLFQNRVSDSNRPCSETAGLSNAPKSVGYARVSTQHQNLDQQLAALKNDGCDLVFGEKVSSTVPANRRESLQKALGALEPGDTLVMAKLDRLGRTQSEVVARLAALQSEGKFVRTLDGLLNTTGLGKLAPLVVGLLTGLAEVERNLVQERTRENDEHRRRT